MPVAFLHFDSAVGIAFATGSRLARHGRKPESEREGELRARFDQALGDQRENDVALLAGFRRDEVGHAESLHRLAYGLHVAARDGRLQGDRLRRIAEIRALERLAEDLDGLRRQGREIGNGPLDDFAVYAAALPQQDGGFGVPVRHFLDVHGNIIAYICVQCNVVRVHYMGTFGTVKAI